ncbi:MAG: Fic family protein, partial [Desulfosporosinus sp.]
RMSRLLTTLLLYRSGYVLGKYISLEKKIAQDKELYYDTLQASQDGWHEGTNDSTPFIKYLLRIIVASYKDLEDRVSIVETKQLALEQVRMAVVMKIGKFTKSEIMELCPGLSKASVENSLTKLVEEGIINRHGLGRATYYVRSDAE